MTTTMEKKENGVSRAERMQCGCAYAPGVDIIENQNEVILLADVPGATAKDIDINFEQGELTIHAHIPSRQGDETRFLLREYGVGDFHRTFAVGEGVDAQAIRAQMSNGVLKVHLPKSEKIKPRKIAVQSE
ncbi:MAG: Hsp20/alpha crystallin family protein [Planctomycetes bacterium]|nr:Hsp20/alpha crystallin family protein [Planctomycetota bacterium]MBI3833608.1 Hsp20/alpha crystallin family protein [Planctomycetota bacterium]